MARRSRRVVNPHLFERSLYLDQNVPIGGTAHRAGILVFGEDSATSVLDRDCKAHELDTLYVTDATLPLPLEPLTCGNQRQDVEGKADLVRSGGLISYGVDPPDRLWPVATDVDTILRGAKAGDLPMTTDA